MFDKIMMYNQFYGFFESTFGFFFGNRLQRSTV